MRCLYNQTYVHNRALSIFDNEGNKSLACVYMFLKCKQRNTEKSFKSVKFKFENDQTPFILSKHLFF